ncbi:MAG: hypothetical protein NTX22_07845 [Ignavibacteriales bacterium]|nr:hypothetical protein [Ignavibacteriales bacterium]
MIRKIKNIVWAILRTINLGGPIQLMLNGALVEDGWFKSYKTKTSVDGNGNPIPWYTYGFIKFLEPRLKKHFNVFEYGLGNSTLWYAKKVNTIKSVEHDRAWFEKIVLLLPDNAKVVYRELEADGNYAKEILEEDTKYHVVIIDGRDRNNCVKYCINKLTADGVIIYDNTQVPEYADSINLLLKSGFKKIDFVGMLPIVNHNNTTTIFYRNNNCLEI